MKKRTPLEQAIQDVPAAEIKAWRALMKKPRHAERPNLSELGRALGVSPMTLFHYKAGRQPAHSILYRWCLDDRAWVRKLADAFGHQYIDRMRR